MKRGLTFILLTLAFGLQGQTVDARILKHYSPADIADMDSLKFAEVDYYFCKSYILDTSLVNQFNLDDFDIKPFENSRHRTNYVSIERKSGLKITLLPEDLLIHHLAIKSYFIVE